MTTRELTPFRAKVLATVATSRATRRSPTYLVGQAFGAALWLYEAGLIGKVGRGFYPLRRTR